MRTKGVRKMNISSIEYHTRMLHDLAEQNGHALLLALDTVPEDRNNTHGCIQMYGGTAPLLNLITNCIKELAESSGIPPAVMCDMIKEAVAKKEAMKHD